jgi:hypothetical protein
MRDWFIVSNKRCRYTSQKKLFPLELPLRDQWYYIFSISQPLYPPFKMTCQFLRRKSKWMSNVKHINQRELKFVKIDPSAIIVCQTAICNFLFEWRQSKTWCIYRMFCLKSNPLHIKMWCIHGVYCLRRNSLYMEMWWIYRVCSLKRNPHHIRNVMIKQGVLFKTQTTIHESLMHIRGVLFKTQLTLHENVMNIQSVLFKT